ncbi:hypothetical protein CQ12_13815 [Bradyrhizobium jicamae]|uniref:Uncharacterized protein n=1 Tax=Bradyrhizobium jicamae TaxID=280332 RepID=A0A0R3LP07_9BRAD|nr:hypothetical protein [Bradyrhizobium jicamae]KRR09559.1 hypothetical protein CQ12_13815 [Bradyrhizobium jicamae]
MTEADRVHSTPPTNAPIDTKRRRFLSVAAGGAVAAAIPTTVSTAAAADPIFAAIYGHRKAQAIHSAAIDELNRLERIHGDQADGGITEKPCHDENEAFGILLGTAATTQQGLIAKLEYLRAIAQGKEAWMLDEREGTALDLIESFTTSISTIWGVQS